MAIVYHHKQKGFLMKQKLTLIGIFCVLSALAFMQTPRTVLSHSVDRVTTQYYGATLGQERVVNALASSQGGHDFEMPQQQVAPTPTPVSPLATPTNTPVPAPTNTAVPTPTSTVIPAPTSLPPTGADLTSFQVNDGWNEVSLSNEVQTDVQQEAGGQSQPSYLANGSLLYPVHLAAPAIGLDTEVKPLGWRQVTEGKEEISIWHMVDKAAGWHLNSVVPGQVGNAVISGHNNVGGSVFRNLDRLQPGDEITVLTNVGTELVYTVSEVEIVPEKYASATQRAANAQAIGATSDERLTLITCWPANSNTHRVIVVAHPVK